MRRRRPTDPPPDTRRLFAQDAIAGRRWRRALVPVTRLDGTQLIVNSDLVEHIEANPDTVVTLTTGHRFIVKESAAELVERIVEYQRRIRETSAWAPAAAR
jgi:flagellar protein FlbD